MNDDKLTQEIALVRQASALIDQLVDSENLLVRVEARRIRDIISDLLFEIDFPLPDRGEHG